MSFNRNPGYRLVRFDTMVRIERDKLLAKAFGWVWDETKPQYAILEPNGDPADWPLINDFAEAMKEVREFNQLIKDDDGARSEFVWQQRMAGDMEVF